MATMRHALICIVLVLAACAPTAPQSPADPYADVRAQSFSSQEELLAFIRESGSDGDYAERGAVATDMAVAESAPMPAMAGNAYSETNVQVQGIDEADLVKTDGDYLYILSGTTLFIVSAESHDIVSTIAFDEQPEGLFAQDDTLAVFGDFRDLDYFRDHGLTPRYGMTYVDMYDIGDRENPALVRSYKFEGRHFQSRMKDGKIYLVVTSVPELRPVPMPIIMEGDTLRHVPIADVAFYDMPYDNVQFATIHAIGMDDDTLSSKTVAVEGGQQLYMSHENIYITSTEWVNEWELRQDIMIELLENDIPAGDRELIGRIELIDADILDKYEKRNKILQVYQRYAEFLPSDERDDLEDDVETKLAARLEAYEALEYTIIHRIGYADGRIQLGATGTVPGSIHNQFALDEHDGVLRIATTVSQRWNSFATEPGMMMDEAVDVAETRILPPRMSESANNVYTLDMDMNVLDRLEGLAEGERIFATRFIGAKLYMVTFRQVDPFFVIDLSDPDDIKGLGELKIPGFSRYLHPYDDNVVIGIGRDATATGRQQGIKISLFDVSNPAKPRELANWIADEQYSQTSAEWEHKAFLFSKEKNLLVIPAYSYDWSRESRVQYNGAMVFRIEEDGIELRGIVDHSQGRETYGSQVQRSLYIDDELYTLSEGLLRVNALDDLHSVANVTLSSEGKKPYPVY